MSVESERQEATAGPHLNHEPLDPKSIIMAMSQCY